MARTCTFLSVRLLWKWRVGRQIHTTVGMAASEEAVTHHA